MSPTEDKPYTPPSQVIAAPQPPIAPAVEATPASTPSTPEPLPAKAPKPKRSKRRLLKTLAKLLFVLLIAGAAAVGALFAVRYQASRNDPTKIFSAALTSALSTSQVETKTTIGSNSADVSLDFSVPTNIQSSNQATVSLAGATVQLAGYGSAKNSYISYQKLPSAASKTVTTIAQDAWVQLRANGTLPAGVNATLSNVADPRYQAFGPVVFGNFLPKTSQQLINYATSHDIYHFEPKQVHHQTVDGQKVLAYPTKLGTSNLKILNDSAASSEGFEPGDVQAAVNKFDAYKNAAVTMYVTASGHQFMGVDINLGQAMVQIRYSNFDHVNLPAEPQTKLMWLQFAPIQLQIEAQAASSLTPPQVDALRQTKLASIHSYLATYFATNNAYPTFTQLNDQTWVQNNLAGLDPDALHDPLASSLQLATAAAKNSFTYLPVAADGKTICDNLTQNCSHYQLTTVLSTNQPYTVHDP